MTRTENSKTLKRLSKDTNRILGKKTPKKPFKTTGIIMDASDLDTLKAVAHWRVITGDSDRASVSDLVREAVREYIARHGLSGVEYSYNNRDRLGPI